jgi:hypothetical protein
MNKKTIHSPKGTFWIVKNNKRVGIDSLDEALDERSKCCGVSCCDNVLRLKDMVTGVVTPVGIVNGVVTVLTEEQVMSINNDSTVPTLVSAVINDGAGTEVVLTFSEPLGAYTAATTAYTLSGKTINSANVSGNTVTLVVSATYLAGDTVAVSYTRPFSNFLRDTNGHAVVSFVNKPVTNNLV